MSCQADPGIRWKGANGFWPGSWLQPVDERFHPAKGLGQLLPGDRIGTAEVIVPAAAKDTARHHGDPLFPEQPFCKFHIGEPGTSHRGECVECPLGHMAGEANLVETGNKHVTPEPVLVDHARLLIPGRTKRFERTNLSHHRGAEHDILVDLERRVANLFWRTEEAYPPAGHRVRLGEPVERDR